MKRIVILAIAALLAVALAACTTLSRFELVSAPPDRNADQRRMDDAQCNQISRVQGPWLFGIGSMVMANMTEKRYSDCMTERGYVVRLQN